MMKRRNILLAVITGVALAVAGCGSSSSDEESVVSEEVTEEAAAEDSGGSEDETQEDSNASDETEDSGSVSAADASELLLEWKTTQYFTEEEVAQEDVEKILQAGINTTSSMNGQPWHFTAVTDAEILEEIGSAMSFGGGSAAPAGDFSAEDLPEDFDPGNAEEAIEVPQPEASEAESAEAGESGETAEGTETAEESEAAEEISAAGETQEAQEAAETEEAEATEEAGETAEAAVRSKAALGDTPLAIIVSCAEGSELDAGLATQSMFIEARLLGYGAKIVSSPTIVLNGDDAEYYKELLGIPDDYSVVSVLLVGYEDTTVDTTADGMTGASERLDESEVVTYIE